MPILALLLQPRFAAGAGFAGFVLGKLQVDPWLTGQVAETMSAYLHSNPFR